MCEVLINNSETVSTIEATDILVKILNSSYVEADLEQVSDNATQMKAEDRTQLLRLLQYFEGLFGGILGDWYTDPVELELNLEYKPFNCKYYLVPIINRDDFCKEPQRLVKILVLTPLQ